MIECICNNIRTRDVEKALSAPPEKTTPAQIYKAAAIAAGCARTKMQCGTCSCRFEEIAASHNADKGLIKIREALEPVAAAPAAATPKIDA